MAWDLLEPTRMTPSRKLASSSLMDLLVLQREVNQLFERLAEMGRSEPPTAGGWSPSIDIYESRGKLVVVVEVPGLTPESVRVVFRDRQLVVSGERRERRPTPGSAAFVCMERPAGRFSRTIPLEPALDVQKAEARLQGGLLTIFIPRLKDRRGRDTVVPVRRGDEP
jgi:HSP20 family protein